MLTPQTANAVPGGGKISRWSYELEARLGQCKYQVSSISLVFVTSGPTFQEGGMERLHLQDDEDGDVIAEMLWGEGSQRFCHRNIEDWTDVHGILQFYVRDKFGVA